MSAVAIATSVKPSAEPTSMRPVSNKAMPVRMVPSSAPVSRANALACGSATGPATDAVASWVRPATSWASRRSAASPQPAPFANPAPAHTPNGSPPRSDRGIGGCVSQMCRGTAAEASSALITSGGRCLPSVASWLSARSTLASHPWRVAASAARSAIASPRLDITKPTADVIDQATQPSHSTRPAIARMWKRLFQRLSANNGAANLEDISSYAGNGIGGLVHRMSAQGQPVLQVRADAHGAEGRGGSIT